MSNQRLLLAPRSFHYVVDKARLPCGFRLALLNRTDTTDRKPRFFLNISDASAGRIMFTFQNTAPEDYTITHVYFDDGENMAIDVVRESVEAVNATTPDGKAAGRQDGTCPQTPPLHENLAVTFDLNTGIGMADIVCALADERLKVNLKTVRRDTNSIEIFASEPVLSLTNATVQ